MKNFSDKVAVVTGGGTGMGRELCRQLSQDGCHVAMCDVSSENMAETKSLCESEAPPGITITTHNCDVSVESEVIRFRTEVEAGHGPVVNLLFNNAGIGGGGSFLIDEREDWEKTFGVCWYGVYYVCRAFVPMLVASEEGHIINTSSVNGFWASLGPLIPHTAYSAAKFAVKGFSEALINDLRINAPHVGVSVVMPGHIGTSIAINSGKVLGKKPPLEMGEQEVRELRERMMRTGGPMTEAMMNMSDEQIKQAMHDRQIQFRDNAPLTAAQASTIILDGVRSNSWRILVGEDAHRLDNQVRANPEAAYEPDFAGLSIGLED
ncbi:MAG: SDR family NAD(P)-dependent oxidoreductase [Gammaproteobacteria bacterium]|nr:SDR family NAD(P)-dependent oxidoreductase [Gammaproteobacteria bacterium]